MYYGVVHLHTNRPIIFIICWCLPVKEPGRIEKKNWLERLGKSKKAR